MKNVGSSSSRPSVRPSTTSDLSFYSPVFSVDSPNWFLYFSTANDALKADMVLVEDHRSNGTTTPFRATDPVFEQHAM